jgi:AraC-like DNA-binding protein
MRIGADLINLDSPCLTTEQWEHLAWQAEFSLGRMASLSGLSVRQLQRVFKKQLRCTPTQWLRELRCRYAKRLILRGYSSKAAAAELNYASDAHFCREFKKVFGVSPQSFAPGGVQFPWDRH